MGNGSGTFNFPPHGTGVIHSRRESNQILHILSNIQGADGINIEISQNGGIIVRGNQPAFSGRVWSAGTLYEDLDSDDTKPWVKIPHDGSAPTEVEVGPGSPAPDDATYIEKEYQFGDFHLPRV